MKTALFYPSVVSAISSEKAALELSRIPKKKSFLCFKSHRESNCSQILFLLLNLERMKLFIENCMTYVYVNKDSNRYIDNGGCND